MDTDDVQLKNQQLTEEIGRLNTELDKKTLLAEEQLNQLKYLRSDFDNYRKWSEKEKGAIIALANENLIKNLLEILDDFERALPSLEQEKNKAGMEMIYKNFKKILSSYGLQPIDCVGKKFDPQCHEALCTEKCKKEQNTVLAELEKGYRLKSKVIRPSKVKIAEPVVEDEGENNG
ncbi:nucleotide exchange factor GrpE [uncultured Methanoregula sp.]|uniref:nucleotide exchange factor GrpE n=1 Tax=uncultured Methanoregula sp. TaxID=1005933 RepID=UPI002AAB2F21|nr:nucleotide exchange factor GrpE [uncultured Methanoregula sp.]